MEPGYPKSILRDFMGCQSMWRRGPGDGVAVPPFNPDGVQSQDGAVTARRARRVVRRSPGGATRQGRADGGSRVVVQMEVTRTVNMVMVLVPPCCCCSASWASPRPGADAAKGAPRMLLYCKRSLQEWV